MDSIKMKYPKWKINIKHEPRCALHIKSEMNEKPIKHDPGYAIAHDLSGVHHDPGYTPAYDPSVTHDWTAKADDDGNVYHSKKIIKTEPMDRDDRTDDKHKSEAKVVKSGE